MAFFHPVESGKGTPESTRRALAELEATLRNAANLNSSEPNMLALTVMSCCCETVGDILQQDGPSTRTSLQA